MTAAPLKCRALAANRLLYVNDNGTFFKADVEFADRFRRGTLDLEDVGYLQLRGHLVDEADELAFDSHCYSLAERLSHAGPLDYLILVPTLRCNLACSYCQVSRANENAAGFDWTPETLSAVCRFIDTLQTDSIKIEFQGGEPTLRPDLIRSVIERCERFSHKQFVICTNLQSVDPEVKKLFDREDVFISTSLDGDAHTHDGNRTHGKGQSFFANLDQLLEQYGPGKLSALPTINPAAPPDIDALIEAFESRGLTKIFLRPINFQGFARKRHSHAREQDDGWRDYYRRFVERLIERNWADGTKVLEETYLSICLGRIFHPGRTRHVDLRNPNPIALDYLVIDFDGSIYPTDESRMLTRSRVVDLRLGKIGEDWKGETWALLNQSSTNQFDPACERCVYQPFCGRNLVDDLARYGRVDLPRTTTEFCRKHLWLFDFIFELIFTEDEAVQHSLRRWLRLEGEPKLAEVFR